MTARTSLPDSRRARALTPKRLKMEADRERYAVGDGERCASSTADRERYPTSTLQPQPHRHEQEPERHAEGARQEVETGDASIHSIAELPTYTRQQEEEGVRGGGSMWGVCDEADSEAETHKYIDTERDGDGGGPREEVGGASQSSQSCHSCHSCPSASRTCHTKDPPCNVDRQIHDRFSGEELSGAGDEWKEEGGDGEWREDRSDTHKGKGSMEGFTGVIRGKEEQVREQVGVDGTGEEEEEEEDIHHMLAQSLVSLSVSLIINCIS